MAKKKLEGTKFADMDDEQLAEARAALDAQMTELRNEKKEITDRLDPTVKQKAIDPDDLTIMRKRVEEINLSLNDLRAQKKAIQDVVDARLQPLGKADHILGIGPVESKEAFGKIGGK